MADLEKFQAGVPQILFSSYGDSQFDVVRTVCGGMSGVKTGKLLNFAVECLNEDELYFEIGVYTGFTMIAAGLGHHRHIIGIDDSSQFGDVRVKAMDNMAKFAHPLYQFISADFRNVAVVKENERKAGVLYIDGKHDYKEVVDSLTWAENGILADRAIVVLDDIAVKGVSSAINDWLAQHKAYKSIFHIEPYSNEEEDFWSHDISVGLGLAVLKRDLYAENAYDFKNQEIKEEVVNA